MFIDYFSNSNFTILNIFSDEYYSELEDYGQRLCQFCFLRNF